MRLGTKPASCLSHEVQCRYSSLCRLSQSGETPLLIATDVAARGLDIDDVEVVINYSFPLVRHINPSAADFAAADSSSRLGLVCCRGCAACRFEVHGWLNDGCRVAPTPHSC
jgi:hypothetical protein